MEEKQLDYNQPFLSARRYSVVAMLEESREQRRKLNTKQYKLPPLPAYKSELKSGPIRNPGKVPFVWERIPGKPKEEKELRDHTVVDSPLDVPKLPPGRSRDVELKHQDPVQLRGSKNQSLGQQEAKDGAKHTGEVEDKEVLSSEDGDDAFVDARDTFSRTDSYILNSSVISGLSGLNDSEFGSPERLDTDPATRDFMIGRFLPAAKALASEKTHHMTRKPPPFPHEIRKPEMVSKAQKIVDRVANEHCPVLDQNKPKIPLRNILNGYDEGGDDDDWDEYENPQGKICGMLPRFCLLNPVPVMKSARPPRPPSAGRVQTKSSNAVSVAENMTMRTTDEDLKEHRLDSARKLRKATSLYKRLQGNAQCVSSMDVSLKDAFQAEVLIGKDAEKLDSSSTDAGPSPYQRWQGNGQRLKPNEVSLRDAFQAEGSTPEKLDDSLTDSGNSPPRKPCMNFRELLASEGSGWEKHSTDPAVEKTLHVDSVQLVKSQKLDSPCSFTRGISHCVNIPTCNAAVSNPAGQEYKQFDLFNEKSRESGQENKAEFPPLPSGKSDTEACTESSTHDLEHTMGNKAMDCRKVSSQGKVHGDCELPTKLSRPEGQEISSVGNFGFHIPPPLPKSPSDSWLSRTLLSSKTPLSANIATNTRTIIYKLPPNETKWETIVRTSNTQPGHLRSSKELLPTIPDA